MLIKYTSNNLRGAGVDMSEMIALSDFDDDDRHYMKWMSKKLEAI